MSLLNRLRDRRAEPEPTAEPDPAPAPSPTGSCTKCAPAHFDRGPKFHGHVAARGRAVPSDNGLRVL
ncbi:hypothetical protein [Mycobacteroides abscessus]|nr:hypothetical protein [Mycobacteroides abscessus]